MKMELKSVQDVIHDNMMLYANYIITDRVLPDLRDGFKPVYRRILFTMHRMNAVNLTKSQNVEGKVMEIHPHGGCYPTIVKMVQKDRHITPMIVGKGNFGKHTSSELQPAAQRYTEIKMSDMAKSIFKDIDKNMVEFIPNYDGQIMMPEALPVKFPTVLHYGQQGTAVGMATQLVPFGLIDINEATKKYIKTGEHTTLIPDFATGGKIVLDVNEMEKVRNTGLGKVTIRAKAEIKDNKITITEVPYGITSEKIIDSITKLVKNKKIDNITNIDNFTGKSGLKIQIKAKKNTDMKMLLEKLYTSSPMETSISTNMNILVNGLPKVMGTAEIIERWVEWRRSCLVKGKVSEIKEDKAKLHKLLGLEKILVDVDEAINIIRHSKSKDIEKNLMKHFNMDLIQAEYVSNIQLRNINEEEIVKRVEETKPLKDKIKDKEDYINNIDRINNTIIDDLDDISKKFGKPRISEIVEKEKVDESKMKLNKVIKEKQKEVSNEEFRIVITKSGYVQKLSKDKLVGKIKEGDDIVESFIGNNESEILVYSGKSAYKVYVENLDKNSDSDFGTFIPTLLELKDISGYAFINNSVKYILTVYDNMKIAKVDVNSYKTSSKRTKLDNCVSKKANIVMVQTLDNDIDLTLHWKKKEIIYNTSKLKPKSSRDTQGVNVNFEKVEI